MKSKQKKSLKKERKELNREYLRIQGKIEFHESFPPRGFRGTSKLEIGAIC